MEVTFECRCGRGLEATFFDDDETDIVHCSACKRAYVVILPVVLDINELHKCVHKDNEGGK